jgi:hypothetical protein
MKLEEIKGDVAVSRRSIRWSFPPLKNPTAPGTPRGPSDDTRETDEGAFFVEEVDAL